MQIALAALENIFGHQKKGVKYLRRLFISRKPCPILYLFSQKRQALDFVGFLLSLASQRKIAAKMEARQQSLGQVFSYQSVQKLTASVLEEHLVRRVRGAKMVVLCEEYPWLLANLEDEAVLFLEIKDFDLQSVLGEVEVFSNLLLKEIGFDGRPNTEFKLGI